MDIAAPSVQDTALLYADKLTFGATPALVEEIAADPAAWLDAQLAPATILEDPVLEATLATYPTLHLVGATKQAAPQLQAGLKEAQLAAVLRAVMSRRQLLEVMVRFWHDHFNVAILTNRQMMFAADYDRALRGQALGRFADLLRASAQTVAMMLYLDNAESRWPSPNENYARELLELHTVGVDGGYDEHDVRQAAVALTGWGHSGLVLNPLADAEWAFAFDPDGHYTEGPVQVMDWSAPAMSGPEAIAQGEGLMDHLAHHPSSARFLSTKLVRRFLGDGDHGDLVDHLAQVYLANDTAIVPWLRALVTHPTFLVAAGSKLRRPMEHLVASLRALQPVILAEGGSQSLAARGLLPLLGRLGHAPFAWATPDGYPDEDVYWAGAGSVLARWNGLLQMVRDQVQGVRFDQGGLHRLATATTTVGELVDTLSMRLLVRPLPEHERAAPMAFLDADPTMLAIQLPDRKFRVLCALILSTHTAAVR